MHSCPSLFTFRPFVHLLALTLAMMCIPALADDYDDVSQLMRTGHLPEAMLKADQYLTTKPRDPQMRFFKGLIQQGSGRLAEALATFTALTEDYPELPEPHNNAAVLYAAQNQFDKARAALEMAIRTNPNYATAHENLGDVYTKLANQAYLRAQELGATSATLLPKITLSREVLAPKPTPAAK
jgi:tetratricopeptide (TPR) repeat protein